MKDQIEPLFTKVLMICDKEGLIGRQIFQSMVVILNIMRVKGGVAPLKS
jgi:hypothetical protein